MVYGSRNDLSPPQGSPPPPPPQVNNLPPPRTGPPPLSSTAVYYRKLTDWGTGFVIFAWIVFAALAGYLLYTSYTSDPIKDIVEDSGDVDAVFNTLLVEGNTTLGNDIVDDLTVNAEVSTHIVPATDSQYSLGQDGYKWDELHTDNIYYASGVSVTSTSSGPVKMTDGFGYRMRVDTLTSGVSRTLTQDESGYLFVVEDDPSQTNGTVTLPLATGSGIFYDFVCGTNVGISGSPAFTVQTDPSGVDDLYGSVAVVVENSGPGDPEYSTIFTQQNITPTVHAITAGPSYPINYGETGERGILTGSEFRVTDYDNGVWLVDGTMIVASGLSVGNMNSPFGGLSIAP